jgi:hypothetical protein
MQPKPASTVEPSVATTPVAGPPQVGFTLRFKNDDTLTLLAGKNEVGLYAIFPDKSFRMSVNRGRLSFRPASTPLKFHEMDGSTVPYPVVDAFQRSNGVSAEGLQWGVTIPAGTARQLDQYLRNASGGTLIIEADGNLRLEN